MPEYTQPPVFLPDNEPYLGLESLHIFDLLIPIRLEEHAQIAAHTGGSGLSDLQRAAIQIVPQTVGIALAIRELIRQAYLFPAFILLRPLIERTATVAWLRANADAVVAWHAGWPRSAQPRLPDMLTALHHWDELGVKDSDRISAFSKLLHRIVHGDPSITLWNIVAEPDGKFSHAMGKMVNNPGLCDFISQMTLHYFSLATKLAQETLLPAQAKASP